MFRHRNILVSFAVLALTACGQQATVQEALDNDISPEQIKASYDAITASRPEVQAALNQLGFNSINDMKPNVFYTILADGKIIQTLPLDANKITPQQLGIGTPNIVEEVNGIVAGRLDAYSTASISCLDFNPFDGIEARATVTHTIAVVGPNSRSFGPYTSSTATAYGYARTAKKFMGGSTTATGRYAFSYFLEASCDGAKTFGRGESIWSVRSGGATVATPLVLAAS